MKTAKELLQAYINGTAQESAALFAEKGALELPYLADLGVEPRYEGPKNIGAFLTFLHEKMYPSFKFIDVKIYIDTPDQAFGEYTIQSGTGAEEAKVRVEASIGLVQWRPDESMQEVIERADAAMYKEKKLARRESPQARASQN